jgi:hypothetical protein
MEKIEKIGKQTYRPFFFGWCPKGAEDGFELVHVAFAWQIRRAEHQLRKDAPNGPYVHSGAVIPAPKQQFRRSIPSGWTKETVIRYPIS